MIFIISFYPIYIYASTTQIYSFIYGYLISFLNVLIGYGLIETALSRGIKKFMAIIFGGMFIRIFLAACLIIVLISYANADTMALVSSVFLFYFVFISIEIHYLHKRNKI
ncbi:MAG: hypothetical protein ACRDFC_07265, partial [Ignavibacteria bacterium]